MVLAGLGGGVAVSAGRSWWWGVLVGFRLVVVGFFGWETGVWEEKEGKGWVGYGGGCCDGCGVVVVARGGQMEVLRGCLFGCVVRRVMTRQHHRLIVVFCLFFGLKNAPFLLSSCNVVILYVNCCYKH